MNCALETYQKIGQQLIWKKPGLRGYIYDFSVDYDSILVFDILDIHMYLMKRNGIL